MFKKCLIVLAALTLGSCDKPQYSKVGADGYTFGTIQYVKTDLRVEVTVHMSREALVEAAKEYGEDRPDLAAFSILYPKSNLCKVHIVNPEASYEPEFIGHELIHCVYGQWHTNNDSRS